MAKLSSVDRARDRARVIGHLKAGCNQRDVVVLLGVSQSTLSKLRLRYRDTHDVKDMPTSGRPRITTDRVESGSFNWPGEFEESSHHCTQPTDALFRTSWQAGVCTDHQEPATCFPVEIPESCQKPLLTAGVTIGFIDDQSCMWLIIGTERFWQIYV